MSSTASTCSVAYAGNAPRICGSKATCAVRRGVRRHRLRCGAHVAHVTHHLQNLHHDVEPGGHVHAVLEQPVGHTRHVGRPLDGRRDRPVQ